MEIAIFNRAIGAEVNAVDARELHAALGVGARFNDWIARRISDLGLVQGVDFEKLSDSAYSVLSKTPGRDRIDYALTLDAAKHVAMAERNERGREVRAYFIEAEKRLRAAVVRPVFDPNDPRVIVAVLQAQVDRVRALEAEVAVKDETIAELEPKAAAHDALTSAPETLGFREAVKVLHRTTGVTESEARALMIDRGWVQRLNGRLQPAHYGSAHGYVVSVERSWTDVDGGRHATPELRITQKGLARLSILLSEAA